ncbi:MAG: hypothetical protein MK085_00830 [Phycisphaerales bacterium]|nr:hypothetical protein [Phycisphaerales bacterium]
MSILRLRAVVFALAAVSVFMGIAAQGQAQTITMTSVIGFVEGEASVYDFDSGKDSSDGFFEIVNAFDDLPVSGSATAEIWTGDAESGATMNGEQFSDGMSLSMAAYSYASADAFEASASSYGESTMSCIFTVDAPMWVEIEFVCLGDVWGDAAASFYAGNVYIIGAEAYGDEFVTFNHLLVPGVEYEIYGQAYGGSSGEPNSDYVTGNCSISMQSMCDYSGVLQLGDNAFDTAKSLGNTLDMDGICDPGDFGDDIIFNTSYYSFTPDITTTYTFSTCNLTELDTRLAILTQGCDNTSVIACTDDSPECENWTSIMDVHLEAGVTYTFAIGATFSDDFGMGMVNVSLPVKVMYPVAGTGVVRSSGYTESQCGEVNLDDSDFDIQEFDALGELPINTSIGYSGNGGTVEAVATAAASVGYNRLDFDSTTMAGACTQTGSGCEWVTARGTVTADLEFILQRSSNLAIEYRVDSADEEGTAPSSITMLDGLGNTVFFVEDTEYGGDAQTGIESINLLPGQYTIEIRTYSLHTGMWCASDEDAGVSIRVVATSNGFEGDLNGDGAVNGADLGLMIGAWGTTGPGDLNGDGIVDAADLGMLLALWSV